MRTAIDISYGLNVLSPLHYVEALTPNMIRMLKGNLM